LCFNESVGRIVSDVGGVSFTLAHGEIALEKLFVSSLAQTDALAVAES